MALLELDPIADALLLELDPIEPLADALLLELDPIEPLANALYILCRLSQKCHFKWTPTSFSIIVSQNKPFCISTFTILPQLSIRYHCRRIYEVKLTIVDFFVIMTYLHRMGVSSLTFSMPNDQTNITLQYRIPCQPNLNTKVLSTSIVKDHKNVDPVDYGSFFVSIALEEFQCLVKDMNNSGYVHFTITSSCIKFVAEIDHWESILTSKEGGCIIGGVEEDEEIECGLCLYPMEFYKAFTSKRVWFFNTYDPNTYDANGLLLIAPMGLYTHISSLFPHVI